MRTRKWNAAEWKRWTMKDDDDDVVAVVVMHDWSDAPRRK